MTTAIILAGGLGTRLRSAVPDLPKPMAPVDGIPFLEHQLNYWMDRGVKRFILSVGYRHDAIMDHFGHGYRHAEIVYAVEEAPLGTGGGLRLALEDVPDDEAVLVLNGDTFFDVGSTDLLAIHMVRGAALTLALFRAQEDNRYGGVVCGYDGRVTLLNSGKAKRGDLASGGVYVLTPGSVRSRFPKTDQVISLEDEILPSLLSDGTPIFGVECTGAFIDIGVPEDYTRAADIINSVRRPAMVDAAAILRRNLEASIAAKQRFLGLNEQIETFSRATDEVVRRYRAGGRIYIAGNGGSAADAQHLAAEFVSKLARDRAPLPAEALTVDSSILTAIGNDYGYEKVFSRQIDGKMGENDIFLGITTSGNSQNIIAALETCRERSIPSIVFCGREGGRARDLADYCIVASGEETGTIQEVHIVLAHSLCESVERAIFGD